MGRGNGELFVLSAPSGAGKTTLCRAVCARVEGLLYSVSYTTRPPRLGEVNGRDYFFVSEAVFEEMAGRGEFLEHARVYSCRYGTSGPWVQARLAEGLDVIMDVDVQGADQLRKGQVVGHYVFVLPPSWEVLRERLFSRGQDSPQEMETRLQWARGEMAGWRVSDFVVLNDDLEEATRDLEAVIRSQRCRTQRRAQWIDQHHLRWMPSKG
jgi:guanylate kinase